LLKTARAGTILCATKVRKGVDGEKENPTIGKRFEFEKARAPCGG